MPDTGQDVIEAVLAQRPTRIDLVPAELQAVQQFLAHDAAQALAAANKRIGNILKKADGNIPEPDVALLEAAEKALFERVVQLRPAGQIACRQPRLRRCADRARRRACRGRPLLRRCDGFNVDEPLVRANRLGLLCRFSKLNAVADISRLAV